MFPYSDDIGEILLPKIVNIFQEARCRAWSLNLNVISLYSSQEIDSLARKSRGRVGLVLILACGNVVKILEEQAYLLFKEELHISK